MCSAQGRLSALAAENARTDEDNVLNGIAWDATQKLFYLTGKEWPVVFSGRFSEQ